MRQKIAGVLAGLAIIIGACSDAGQRDKVTDAATAAVTPTVVPTPTPIGRNDPRFESYLRDVQPLLDTLVQHMNRVGTLSGAASPANSIWRTQYRDGANQLKVAAAKFDRLEPPPCLAASHRTLLRATTAIGQAGDLMLDSLALLETGNVSAAIKPITDANARMGVAGGLLTEATDAVAKNDCG